MNVDSTSYAELARLCDERFKYFSSAIFEDVPQFIIGLFGEFIKNPLCLSITSVLLCLSSLVILKRIIFTFNRV